METTKIKEKAIKIYEKLMRADRKDSASDSVKGMMYLAMTGKTTEESIAIKKLFDSVYEREMAKRFEESEREALVINRFLNKVEKCI